MDNTASLCTVWKIQEGERTMSPYYTECEHEGCKTLVVVAGAKRHFWSEHRPNHKERVPKVKQQTAFESLFGYESEEEREQ